MTIPLPPYSHAGEESAPSPPGSEAEGEEGEALAARPRPLTVRLSVAVGPERAATPGEMGRGMGLQLTPREDDWEDFYYLYSDGFGEGTVSGRGFNLRP